MNTILTDDEIHKWWASENGMEDADMAKLNDFREVMRKAEAAVLAKLREQEPVAQPTAEMLATFKAAFDGGSIWAARVKHCLEELFRTHRLYDAPLPAVVQVPQGWKLVPVEPTPEMMDAAVQAICYGPEGGFTRISGPHKTWAAMLAAAPEAPAQGDPLEKLTRIQEELGLYNDKPAQAIPAPWREATEQDAYEMGAKGAPATEQERKLFEAWMRGHCWALRAHWNGSGYVSDAEQGGDLDPRAMVTRQLWAAWRDRAALAQLDSLESGE